MDGRRHSVDIPISKALLALQRVRSLRDPSTHSMSKLSALVDNLNWDTNSTNGITLGFLNGCEVDCIGTTPVFGSKDLGLTDQREETVRDPALHDGFSKPSCNLALYENNGSVPIMSKQVVGSNHSRPNQEVVCETKLVSERCCNGYPEKASDLMCDPTFAGYLEGVDSCNDPIEESLRAERIDHIPSNQKTGHQKQIRSSRAALGDIMSRVGSPCLSSQSTSLYLNEDVNAVDGNHNGCRITCCWSGTPRFSVSNIPSDLEDQPLLSGGVGETLISGEGKSWNHISNEISLSLGSPQSFNQKFSPKSFCELVGQNIVARSLLTAISNARICSFYLFHGPRGTGKTSASRIFAAALNCLSVEETKPCGLCRECVLFFSGRSRDVNEVDSVRINRKDRIRSLIKSASIPPASSRFKIFIIDECQLLRGETWATFLNNLGNLSRHAVFLLITPDLNKLPQSAVSRSQKYHFPKIKDIDIGSRLGSICMKEGLQFEQDALDFVASKSNGSLRDAEMMLEQLSLLGKRITMSLVYELIGIVSDDELLDLLDLALSSDSANTVRRARELMRSRIDPMQLISQLANVIMDVLAGKCQPGSSEVRRKFFSRYSSEASRQQLNQALKILSEAEKQLRASNSQTTWLIVALLQLSSVGNSLSDAHDLRLCEKFVQPRDGDFCSESSPSESSKHLVPCACHNGESCKLGVQNGRETLESIWKKAIEICRSNSLKNILRKHGKLSSVCFAQGLAVVELEFHHPDHVKKAEMSWKLIANTLQSVLGCNVEMRINLMHCVPATKYTKKKISFSLFSCSRRLRHESTTENRSEPSCHSDSASEKANIRDKYVETCSPYSGSQFSNNCCQKKEAMIRNNEGNALSIGMTGNCKCEARSSQEEEKQPGCLFRSLKLHKKIQSSETSHNTCLRFQTESNLELSIPRRSSIDRYCSTNSCQMNCSRDENGLREPCERCSYSLSLF